MQNQVAGKGVLQTPVVQQAVMEQHTVEQRDKPSWALGGIFWLAIFSKMGAWWRGPSCTPSLAHFTLGLYLPASSHASSRASRMAAGTWCIPTAKTPLYVWRRDTLPLHLCISARSRSLSRLRGLWRPLGMCALISSSMTFSACLILSPAAWMHRSP